MKAIAIFAGLLTTLSTVALSGCGGSDGSTFKVQVETANLGGVTFASTRAKLEASGIAVYATRCGNFDPLLAQGGGNYAGGPPRFFEFEINKSDAARADGLGFKAVTEQMLALRSPQEGRDCVPSE